MPWVEMAAATVGIALLVIARRQRVVARRRKRRVLCRALLSPDPAARRAAVQVAGDDGLAHSGAAFLALTRRERDPSVLLVLAQVVLRNQWEPSHDPAVVSLRLWAHRYLESTRPSAPPDPFAPTSPDFDGPSVAEIVNLMMQPTTRRKRRQSWA